MTTKFCVDVVTNWAIMSWLPISPIASFMSCSAFSFLLRHCFCQLLHITQSKSCTFNDIGVVQWTDTMLFTTEELRKLAKVGFESKTTELGSDTLAGWAIKLRVQLVHKPNFYSFPQFHVLFSIYISLGPSHFSVPIFTAIKICYK